MRIPVDLAISDLPGGRLYAVDCPWGRTELGYFEGAILRLSEPQLITILAFRHEEECDRCDLSPVWMRADPWLRAVTEQLAALRLSGPAGCRNSGRVADPNLGLRPSST